MMDSIFKYEFQSIMMKVMMQWMEQYLQNAGETTSVEENTEGNGGSTYDYTGSFSDLIEETAAKYGVDASLVEAVIKAESNFNPDAVSSAGAMGLMQLMPATASGLGVTDAFDPEQNVDGGVRLLSQLLNMYDGNASLALAAYNAGPGAVNTYGGIPPYQETQVYVQRVLQYWQ